MRMRVFDIVLQGRDLRTEPAGDRIALELQHELATRVYRGKFVHVRERWVVTPNPKTERASEGARVGRALPYR